MTSAKFVLSIKTYAQPLMTVGTNDGYPVLFVSNEINLGPVDRAKDPKGSRGKFFPVKDIFFERTRTTLKGREKGNRGEWWDSLGRKRKGREEKRLWRIGWR